MPDVLDEDGELVAAKAHHDVVLAEEPSQEVGERAEHLVAKEVPERVVDILEVVYVEHDHAAGGVGVLGLKVLVHELAPVRIVVEQRERVARGLLLELALPVLLAGDVARDEGSPPALARLVRGEGLDVPSRDRAVHDQADLGLPRLRLQIELAELLPVVGMNGRLAGEMGPIVGNLLGDGEVGAVAVENVRHGVEREDDDRAVGEDGGEDALRLIVGE